MGVGRDAVQLTKRAADVNRGPDRHLVGERRKTALPPKYRYSYEPSRYLYRPTPTSYLHAVRPARAVRQ